MSALIMRIIDLEKTKTRPWRHIHTTSGFQDQKARTSRFQAKKPRHREKDTTHCDSKAFFQRTKATTSRFQDWKTMTLCFQDQKTTTTSFCGTLTLMPPDKVSILSPNARKIRIRKTPNTDTFYAVSLCLSQCLCICSPSLFCICISFYWKPSSVFRFCLFDPCGLLYEKSCQWFEFKKK